MLSIYQGEKITVIGSSGFGKTTMMNIIGCLAYYENRCRGFTGMGGRNR